ncbi:MAG: hypothetical protein LC789_14960 [Actinobacteria bacterium]|nr:hypothetical protein [Actinomycetota bacterium]MCA1721013.1 hypothetical protein [Actinomycetota bacterium]
MVVLGLLLLLASGVFTAGIVLSNTDATSASAFGVSLSNVSVGGLFLAGALAGLVFGLGLAIMLAGAARKRARRKGMKSQVKAVRSERESLAEENARLQAELEQNRSGSGTGDVYPVAGKHAETRTRRG